MVFASQLVTPRGRFAGSRDPYFYLGGDSRQELDVFCTVHGIWGFVIHEPEEHVRYIALPRFLHGQISSLVDEVVKVSEFDRRICSSGEGIPSVATQGVLEGIGGGENHESHE